MLWLILLLWYHYSMVTKTETGHSPGCTCERCTEKLALIVWTTRLFRSLTVQAVRARVAALERLPVAVEELEHLTDQAQDCPKAAGLSPPQALALPGPNE